MESSILRLPLVTLAGSHPAFITPVGVAIQFLFSAQGHFILVFFLNESTFLLEILYHIWSLIAIKLGSHAY